jgi:NTE family protein
MQIALVLAGGAARGAYEIGVLSVVLPALERRGERPTIVVGTSVGAINAASLASTAHLSTQASIDHAIARWCEIEPRKVIRPLVRRQVPLNALLFLGELASIPGVRLGSLLDPSPLGDNLRDWIDWPQLHRNVDEGVLQSVAVIATAAATGRSVAFVEGGLDRRRSQSHVVDYVPARLALEHVRASAAIPLLFPPVRVEEPPDACGWYSDGGTRLNTPIKPALDLGADALVVVATDAITPAGSEAGRHDSEPPDFGDGTLQLLQGALVDRLIEDVRMLGEINMFFTEDAPAADRYRAARGKQPYRQVPYIFIAPRRPGAIGDVAAEVFRRRYRGLKGLRSPDLALLNRLLGGDSPMHGELLSYLLFDRDFVDELIVMGRADAQRWLTEPPGPDEPWQIEPLDAFLGRPPRLRPAG